MGECHGLSTCRTIIDTAPNRGFPQSRFWSALLVEHFVDPIRLHPWIGSRYLDHRYTLAVIIYSNLFYFPNLFHFDTDWHRKRRFLYGFKTGEFDIEISACIRARPRPIFEYIK